MRAVGVRRYIRGVSRAGWSFMGAGLGRGPRRVVFWVSGRRWVRPLAFFYRSGPLFMPLCSIIIQPFS